MILHFFKLFFKGISFFQKNKASILLNAAYFHSKKQSIYSFKCSLFSNKYFKKQKL